MADIFKHFLDRSLAHIKRFSNEPQHFPESVAEHSFYVTYFTNLFCHFLKKSGEEVDELRAIKIALVHDMEESFSGDIIGPFKHYNKEVLAAIRKVGEETIGSAFENLPEDLAGELVELWREDLRQETKEAQVVKLADKLSAISKAYEEIKAGNKFFERIYEKELKDLEKLDYPWWQKIKGEILK